MFWKFYPQNKWSKILKTRTLRCFLSFFSYFRLIQPISQFYTTMCHHSAPTFGTTFSFAKHCTSIDYPLDFSVTNIYPKSWLGHWSLSFQLILLHLHNLKPRSYLKGTSPFHPVFIRMF
ncbi:hypothetical protein V8G54_033739 [Vigna mungo]|uniref:Uncharacterized protein n=1 Tax=Vigna mungo TaxID=3915 RepID=A0AAQ3MNU3_VIGMU